MEKIFTLKEIAEKTGGRIVGDGGVQVSGIADLKTASERHLSFLGNPKYLKVAHKTRAGGILISAEYEREKFSVTCIIVENPSKAFASVAGLFVPEPIRWKPGVHPTSVVSSEARVDEGAYVGPNAVIESGAQIEAGVHIGAGSYIGHGVKIGEETFIYPRVVIYARGVIGRRVIIHSGVVIGADGFGYELVKGKHEKIPQTGYVQVDDDVEIGANTTIDRGRFDRTWIQEGCKIDNLVMIAHNVVIGKHSIVVGQSGIAGSTHCGEYVTIAGHSGIAGHLTIGDRATITGMAGVSKDCEPGKVYSGIHARPMKEMLKVEACTRRLPHLYERVDKIEEALGKKSNPKK